MRLFVAVHPSGQLARELSLRLDPVREKLDSCRALRWTRPEAWHLTLQFLGEWPEQRLEPLATALNELSGAGEFTLEPAGLGAFPGLARPRVLFLQLDSDGHAEQLAARVQQQVQQVWPDGPQDTKAFRAHLTLARVKGQLRDQELTALRQLDLQGLPPFRAEAFHLMASVLHRSGAEHRSLAAFSLAGA